VLWELLCNIIFSLIIIMDIISGDEIPMYPMGHNFKDLAHQVGDSVGAGMRSGARFIYDHPATAAAAAVGAGVLGSVMAPELAVAGGAEALGIVEGEMSSALGSIGMGAGAA
jgi:hypothetical protein